VTGAFHDFEQRGWQRAAAHYPDTFGALTAQAAEPLLDATHVRAQTRLLDVATGPGYVAAAAARRGAHVTGIDFSPAMIDEARRRYPALDFGAGDAQALADADASYDAVVMSFGLLHLERPELALAEAKRVLRAGGRYGFTVWDAPERARGFGIVLEAMKTYGRLDVGLPDGPPFFRFSDHAECRRALAAAGFSTFDVTTVPLVWRLREADELFAAALDGGVRTSAVMQAQTPDALARIREAIHEGAERYREGITIALPMPIVLAAATA
jgi:ubiquinone/menaquinone biosynthesis C-methylase UbiE